MPKDEDELDFDVHSLPLHEVVERLLRYARKHGITFDREYVERLRAEHPEVT